MREKQAIKAFIASKITKAQVEETENILKLSPENIYFRTHGIEALTGVSMKSAPALPTSNPSMAAHKTQLGRVRAKLDHDGKVSRECVRQFPAILRLSARIQDLEEDYVSEAKEERGDYVYAWCHGRHQRHCTLNFNPRAQELVSTVFSFGTRLVQYFSGYLPQDFVALRRWARR